MSETIPHEDSVSQQTIWDFDVSTVPGILNTTELNQIESIEGPGGHNSSPTTSILSSAPSGLLTPTIPSGSNSVSGETGGGNWADRSIFGRKKRVRKSWVYFPENGTEYTGIDGKTRWRCSRCMLPDTAYRLVYSYIYTKRMLNYRSEPGSCSYLCGFFHEEYD